jgi:hypothetical protein
VFELRMPVGSGSGSGSGIPSLPIKTI